MQADVCKCTYICYDGRKDTSIQILLTNICNCCTSVVFIAVSARNNLQNKRYIHYVNFVVTIAMIRETLCVSCFSTGYLNSTLTQHVFLLFLRDPLFPGSLKLQMYLHQLFFTEGSVICKIRTLHKSASWSFIRIGFPYLMKTK